MTRPCQLTNGLADWLHSWQGARFYRIAGRPLDVYLVRKTRGGYEPLIGSVLESIAAEVEVSPRLLLAALALMQLPTRSLA